MKAVETAAATKIQAGFRGYKVRRELREQTNVGGPSTKQAASSNGSGERKQPPPGQQCRSSSCNTHLRNMTESGLEVGLDEDLMQRSAARIQASVRGFLVRRRQHNAAMAAAKIQAGFRGYRTRRELKQLKQRRRNSANNGVRHAVQ